eukprot:gene18389-24088_t
MEREEDFEDNFNITTSSNQNLYFRNTGSIKSENDFTSREMEIREQDRFLPIANIARIMKKVLPGNAKIAKDAKENIQECVSEFISFITSEASDKCQQEKRKTINGDDLLWAMSTLGFEKYIDPLKAYLAKYRDSVKNEKGPDKKVLIRKDNPTTLTYQPTYKTTILPQNAIPNPNLKRSYADSSNVIELSTPSGISKYHIQLDQNSNLKAVNSNVVYKTEIQTPNTNTK